jgi:hypothetical protein
MRKHYRRFAQKSGDPTLLMSTKALTNANGMAILDSTSNWNNTIKNWVTNAPKEIRNVVEFLSAENEEPGLILKAMQTHKGGKIAQANSGTSNSTDSAQILFLTNINPQTPVTSSSLEQLSTVTAPQPSTERAGGPDDARSPGSPVRTSVVDNSAASASSPYNNRHNEGGQGTLSNELKLSSLVASLQAWMREIIQCLAEDIGCQGISAYQDDHALEEHIHSIDVIKFLREIKGYFVKTSKVAERQSALMLLAMNVKLGRPFFSRTVACYVLHTIPLHATAVRELMTEARAISSDNLLFLQSFEDFLFRQLLTDLTCLDGSKSKMILVNHVISCTNLRSLMDKLMELHGRLGDHLYDESFKANYAGNDGDKKGGNSGSSGKPRCVSCQADGDMKRSETHDTWECFSNPNHWRHRKESRDAHIAKLTKQLKEKGLVYKPHAFTNAEKEKAPRGSRDDAQPGYKRKADSQGESKALLAGRLGKSRAKAEESDDSEGPE